MATFRPRAKPKPIELSKFLGINEAVGETELEIGEALEQDNFRITKDYKLQKRPGHHKFIDFTTGDVQAIAQFQIASKNIMLVCHGGKVYEYDLDIDTPTILSSPGSTKTIHEFNRTQYEIFWEVTDHQDDRPGEYDIYQDSVLIETGQWTLGSNRIRLSLENLEPNDYEYAIHIKDNSSNTIVSYLDLTVVDLLEPYVWPHDTIHYEPIYTASWFEFFISETHPDSYNLYRNGTLTGSDALSKNFPFILVDISDLDPGYYIFNLQVSDESGNIGQRNVDVYVTDQTAPYIKRPADLILTEGTTSSIVWEILEANPQSYSLYIDDLLVTTNPLTQSNLTTLVDTSDLGLGFHKFTLLVYDESGKTHSVTCYVVIVDITAPKVSHIADCRLDMEAPDLDLSWIGFDLHPSHYRIYIDQSLASDGSWSNSANIVLHLSSIDDNGTYEIRLEIYDTSDNVAIDEVQVTLIKDEKHYSSSGPPAISAPGFSFFIVCSLMFILNIIRRRKE